jgi:hypothetical protein
MTEKVRFNGKLHQLGGVLGGGLVTGANAFTRRGPG